MKINFDKSTSPAFIPIYAVSVDNIGFWVFASKKSMLKIKETFPDAIFHPGKKRQHYTMLIEEHGLLFNIN